MYKTLGIQLYTVRDSMHTAHDIREVFKALKAMGYDKGQTADITIPYEEFGRIAKEENFEIIGTHENFFHLLNDTEQAIEEHKALGTTNMGIGGLPKEFYESREKALEFCKYVNTIGEKIKPHGMKFTYHNHSPEFKKFDNETFMDIIVNNIDPSYFSVVLDTYWVQYGGGDVRQWIEKLAGKIDLLHLKDMIVWDWDPQVCEVGRGNLWWSEIIKIAEATGVKELVVEQDGNWVTGNALESAKISADYLAQFLDR